MNLPFKSGYELCNEQIQGVSYMMCNVITKEHIEELLKDGRFDEAMHDANLMLDQYESGKCDFKLENVFGQVENYFLNVPNAIIYITYMRRLIGIFEKEGRFDELVDTMYLLSIDYISAKETDQAYVIIEKAMKIAKEKKCFIGNANLLNGLGNLSIILEKYEEALNYFEEAFLYSKSIGYIEGKRFALNIGYALRLLGRIDQSIQYFIIAYEYIKTTDRRAYLANICNEYGYALMSYGDYELAEEMFNKSYDICIETNSKFFLRENYLFRSEFYEKRGLFAQALKLYQDFYKLDEVINRNNQNNQLKLLAYESELMLTKTENEIVFQKNRELDAYSKELKITNAELHKLLTEIEEYKNKLSNADKLLSFERMLSGISHKINTSIGNTLLSVTFLQEKLVEIETAMNEDNLEMKALKTYLESSHAVLDMLVINYSKIVKFIDGMKNIPITIDEMIKSDSLVNVIDSSLKEYEKEITLNNLQIETEFDDFLPQLKSASVLKKVCSELLTNAFKYAFVGKETGVIRIAAALEVEGLFISFTDDGCGMTDEQLTFIFDPFYTTDMSDKGGSGLGLYFVNRMVQDVLKGDIKCISKVGTGTKFVIILPNNDISYSELPLM